MDAESQSRLKSSRACVLFRWSAIWMGLVFAFLVLIVLMHDRIESNAIAKPVFQVLGACLGVVGAFAGLIIFFGMLIYLFRHDSSPTRMKVLWLLAFFVTAWFGSSVYFWAVYRRQVCHQLVDLH
jgi:hypothetical protein